MNLWVLWIFKAWCVEFLLGFQLSEYGSKVGGGLQTLAQFFLQGFVKLALLSWNSFGSIWTLSEECWAGGLWWDKYWQYHYKDDTSEVTSHSEPTYCVVVRAVIMSSVWSRTEPGRTLSAPGTGCFLLRLWDNNPQMDSGRRIACLCSLLSPSDSCLELAPLPNNTGTTLFFSLSPNRKFKIRKFFSIQIFLT